MELVSAIENGCGISREEVPPATATTHSLNGANQQTERPTNDGIIVTAGNHDEGLAFTFGSSKNNENITNFLSEIDKVPTSDQFDDASHDNDDCDSIVYEERKTEFGEKVGFRTTEENEITTNFHSEIDKVPISAQFDDASNANDDYDSMVYEEQKTESGEKVGSRTTKENEDRTQNDSKDVKMSNGEDDKKESRKQEIIADEDGISASNSRSIDDTETPVEDDVPDNGTRENSSRGDTAHATNSLHGSKTRTHNNLDEKTLSALREYLQSKEYLVPLDEEKVMEFTTTTHRSATDRTRYRRNLAEDFEVSGDRDSVYDLIYHEEEKLAMASKFFKDLVHGASTTVDDFDLNSRTLAWLKRACGLEKTNNSLVQNVGYSSGDSEEEEYVATGRRLTRGVKKEQRKERLLKESEGISIFIEAIQEIERERKQPFKSNVQSNSFSEGKTIEAEAGEEDDNNSFDSENDSGSSVSVKSVECGSSAQLRDYPPGSSMIASTKDGREITLRLIFRGKVVSSATNEELEKWRLPRKRRREKERYEARKRIRQTESTQVFADDNGQDLATNVSQKQNPTPAESRLEYFLPDIDEAIVILSRAGKPKPVERFKLLHHAEMFANFYRFLGGRGRRWARHEFFYPDLDAAWYGFDSNAASIAAKIPPGVRLTWLEWKFVRRQLGRPRRFSRSFIAEELSKRNRFRRMVRNLQRSRCSSRSVVFPVPAIFKPGTGVTAYNKRYQLVHEGTVLFYSRGDDGYFVQFKDETLGCEFCPDTEVARTPPTGPPISAIGTHSTANGDGSSRSTAKASALQDVAMLSKNDQAFERFSLTSLVVNLERAKERKKEILDAMEEHNHFVSPFRKATHREYTTKVSSGRMEEFHHTVGAWLHANLIHANRSLQEALDILNAAYLANDLSHDDDTINQSANLKVVGPSEVPTDAEFDFEGDDALLSEVATQLLRSMGVNSSNEDMRLLQVCAKKLLRVQARKILQAPRS